MTASTSTDFDLATSRGDLGAFKPDVASQMEHMKAGNEQSSERRRPNFGRAKSDTFSDAWRKIVPSIGAPR
jgi:hypothetical protein